MFRKETKDYAVRKLDSLLEQSETNIAESDKEVIISNLSECLDDSAFDHFHMSIKEVKEDIDRIVNNILDYILDRKCGA